MQAQPVAAMAAHLSGGEDDARLQARLLEDELWRRFLGDGDAVARDRLFRLFMPWADTLGRSVYRRVGVYALDAEDFVQNAGLGLLDAMSRFEPSRGIDFRAFARARVRGAVFNGVRTMLQERRAMPEAGVYAERLEDLSDGATDAFASVVDAIVGLGIGYLLDHAANAHHADAYAYTQRQQLDANVQAAIARLPERLREVVVLHYYHQVPFAQMAERMGVTRGRLSQLHRDALGRLRDALRGQV